LRGGRGWRKGDCEQRWGGGEGWEGKKRREGEGGREGEGEEEVGEEGDGGRGMERREVAIRSYRIRDKARDWLGEVEKEGRGFSEPRRGLTL
jgi:hypothetical protein